MKSQNLLITFALAMLLLVASGCTSPSDVAGCVTDHDCKGDRICSLDGRCTYPDDDQTNNDTPDADADGSPVTDADPATDTTPQPDVGTPDVSSPDTAVPDTSSDTWVPDAAPSDVHEQDAADDTWAADAAPGDVSGQDAASDTWQAPDADAGPDAQDASPQDVGGQDVSPDASTCPTAVLRARVQGTSSWQQNVLATTPLQTIEFDASTSTGQISNYQWTILSRPQGSTQHLLPNNTSVTPRLFLDLSGTYEVQLEVFDNALPSGCNSSATITITAASTNDVHISVVWDTPSDPDQTDTFGTDVDLHYLHPNGQWDNPPWDLYWRNPTADWGTQGDQSDDPNLDIDDTDGAGPENISHSGLENVTYNVGVYYYSDNTLGASYATLRVYHQGTLVYEELDKYLPRSGSFWHAATISQQGVQVTAVNRMYQGFPGSP